jgi:hypothetical protein
MEYVIPGKKRKNGRRSPYRGRFRLSPQEKFREVPLHTTEKQIARKRLREIVQAEEQERAGFIRPKREREAVQRPLVEHIEAFIAERYDIGRDEKYVRELKKKLLVLAAGCPWKFIADITPESFCTWRRKQKKSPKTLNEYLSAIRGLLNWLEPCVGPVRRKSADGGRAKKETARVFCGRITASGRSGRRSGNYLFGRGVDGYSTRRIAQPGMAGCRLRHAAAVRCCPEIDREES